MKAITKPGLTPLEREARTYVARHLGDQARDVRPTNQNDNIAPLALQHGRYETVDSVTRRAAFEGEIVARVLNRTVTVVDGWIDDDVFTRPQIRVIEYTRDLWRDIRMPRHALFDNPDPEDRSDGLDAERAKNLLRRCRLLVGRIDWSIFENVVRWDEPIGIPGSRYAAYSDWSLMAAQEIVASVADRIRSIL